MSVTERDPKLCKILATGLNLTYSHFAPFMLHINVMFHICKIIDIFVTLYITYVY